MSIKKGHKASMSDWKPKFKFLEVKDPFFKSELNEK